MRILGIDFGSRRIGVAISDPAGVTAQPLTVIERLDIGQDIRKILKLIDDYQVEAVVVGLPISLSGELGPQAKAVLDFVEELKKETNVPINTWDERLTTSIAERGLLKANVKRRRRKQVIDKVAAAILLQGYLDSKK